MCGRYTLTVTDPNVIADSFNIDTPPDDPLTPRYNVAPTQSMLTVVQNPEGKNELVAMRWGLIPSWSKDASRASRMINARAETVAEKPSYRTALRLRRCLVVADGFYEWKVEDDSKRKTPMYIRLQSGDLFGLAGLWEKWTDPETGEILTTCTVITTTPNELLAPIHDRMPVIMPNMHYNDWLNPNMKHKDAVLPLLQTYPADAMTAYPVSTRVNSVRNDAPDLIEPVA